MVQNKTQNQFFCHFLECDSLVFFKIDYNDSLQDCLTSSIGRIYKKNLVTKFGPNQAQDQFNFNFSSLVHQFSFKLLRMITWNNVYLLVAVKPAKSVFGIQVWVKQVKIGPKIRFFIVFSSLVYFLENSICLEHCLTTSRDKPHEKISRALTWAKNYGFCHFLKVPTLVFLDIAHSCRTETSKKQKNKKLWPNFGSK